eukprot:CAMPEP_0197535652 /NCGR_PEP_ID=MMETSP1318-20131121/51278_1 /TAXON_ID=552666 /ORGANISM="Partenskyella glossopodia, Strain RCC365" /LENGTH=504 /DNA_ID=CAMNT_0043093291 /DNA_START=47 /DNA_END=1561 /DNA_ORIENTATION=-
MALFSSSFQLAQVSSVSSSVSVPSSAFSAPEKTEIYRLQNLVSHIDADAAATNSNITTQSRSGGRRAIVQILDVRMEEYIYAIVSTHQALKDLNTPQEIEHVVLVKGGKSDLDISDPNTFKDSYPSSIHDSLKVLNILNITAIPYSDQGLFRYLSESIAHKPTEWVEQRLRSVFIENHMQSFLAKICVFNLTNFERIVFLDNDVIPLQNIHQLFDQATPAAAPDVASGFVVNTGVMVLDPSQAVFDAMMKDLLGRDNNKHVHKKHHYDDHDDDDVHTIEKKPWPSANKGVLVDNDQDFLNYFFADNFHVLSPYWNVLLSIHHGLNGGENTSPVEEWGVVKDSGVFIKWVLRFSQNRNRLKVVHMAFPKPTWPLFDRGCESDGEGSRQGIDDTSSMNTNEVPPWECADKTQVPNPNWWRWYFVDNGIPGKAILSLFKLFWSRYIRGLKQICEAEAGWEIAACTDPDKHPYITDAMVHSGMDIETTLLSNRLIPDWFQWNTNVTTI